MNGLPVTLIEAQVAGLPIYASSNITKEVDISSRINFISLQDNPNVWAEKILDGNNMRINIDRKIIQEKGYEDKAEAIKLQNRYIDLIEKGVIDGKSITY